MAEQTLILIQNRASRAARPLLAAMAFTLLAGCASMRSKPAETQQPIIPMPPESENSQVQIEQLKARVSTLSDKVESLEGKLSAVNDKVDIAKTKATAAMDSKMSTDPVATRPGELSGAEIQTPASPRDPETGFVNDEAVEAYKKAMILFEAQKYPEAVLGFTTFLEKYADHAMAGTAQYYIGESYFLQKEMKLAEQEFQRVLTSYDRSPYISQTLKRLSEVEDRLNMPEAAAKHRQMLASMFPQSPAAASANGFVIKEIVEEKNSETAPAPQAVKVETPPTQMTSSAPEEKPEETQKLDEPPAPTAPMPTSPKNSP